MNGNLIDAIQTFLVNTCGVVCLDAKEAAKFTAARDALHVAMIDAKYREQAMSVAARCESPSPKPVPSPFAGVAAALHDAAEEIGRVYRD